MYDPAVSNHKASSMEVPFPSTHTKPKCQIHFRNLKNIDSDTLTMDLQHLLSTNTSSVSECRVASWVSTHLSKVGLSRSAPWFTSELQRMMALERWYEASGLTVHKSAYRGHQRSYSKSLREAQFYSNIVQKSSGNSQQFFSIIN